MYKRSFNKAINPSRSRSPGNEYGFNRGFQQREQSVDTDYLRNSSDMADEDFRDEDELYLAQEMDQRDSERYQDVGPRVNHYGKGPKGWRPSDLRLKEEVSEALFLDNEVDASDIEVEVQDGIVTLTGFVESRQTKRMAEDLVDDVTGVVDVRNLLAIRVSPPEVTSRAEANEDWAYPPSRD